MNVGFIGLGIMGTPMAKNVLKAGHKVIAFDLNANRVQGLVDAGAVAGTSGKDVAEQSDVVITMMQNSPNVEAALFSDLFPPDVRYTGISIVYQFPGFLVAGIVPGLCTFLINWNEGDPLYVCLFTLLAAVTSALSAFAIQRKSIAAQRKHGDDAEHI